MGVRDRDDVGDSPESIAEEVFQARPITDSDSFQPEPLDARSDDCYRLQEPIANSTALIDDERYVQGGRPMTAFYAVGSYIRRRRGEKVSAEKNGFYKTRHWRTLRQYARGKEMDRQLLKKYNFPSIALLSLRVSPGNKSRVTLLARMKDAIDAAIDQLGYRLQYAPGAPFDANEWQYFAVVAGTDKQATPHVHIVVYCDGMLQQRWFEPVVQKFVEKCPDAPDDMGGNRPEEGAVKIRGVGHEEIPRMDDVPAESAGSTYVLCQLPHLQPVGEMSLDQLLHSSTVDAWKGHAFRRSDYTVWDDEEEPTREEISEVTPTQSLDGLSDFM